MSASISNMRSCRSRRSPHVKLDVQLFPKQRLLIASGRYDLVNKTNAPIRDVHVRQGDQRYEFTKLDVDGARLVSDDKKFGYRIYRFDQPLAPGASAVLTFSSQTLAPRLPGAARRIPTSSRTAPSRTISQFAPIIGMNRQQPARATAPSAVARASRPSFGMAKLEDMSATRAQLYRHATG